MTVDSPIHDHQRDASRQSVIRLVLFDFDGTLTTRDSLLPFLRHVLGTPRCGLRLLQCSGSLLAYAAGRLANDAAKERLLARCLAGRPVADLQARAATFASEVLPGLLRPEMMAVLQRHRTAGDACVLVSASLSVYLHPWAAAHGFEAVLCSRLEADAQGHVTGRLTPRNCHGPEKARRIDEWLAGRRPAHVTAYGDSRGDFEMLAMADAAHWLGSASRRPPAAVAMAG